MLLQKYQCKISRFNQTIKCPPRVKHACQFWVCPRIVSSEFYNFWNHDPDRNHALNLPC